MQEPKIYWSYFTSNNKVYSLHNFPFIYSWPLSYINNQPLSDANANDFKVHFWFIIWEDGQRYGNTYWTSNGNIYFKDKLITGAIIENK